MKLEREDIVGIVGALAHTICLDSKVGQDELNFLDNFLSRVGVAPQDREDLLATTRACRKENSEIPAIRSRSARIYAIQQALLLALSDGEYRRVERAGLKDLAERFGIDEVLFEDLERWAIEGSDWQIRGAGLLSR